MSERGDDARRREAARDDAGEPEPSVDGGTGPGVTPGDVETPGAATTPNLPDEEAGHEDAAER